MAVSLESALQIRSIVIMPGPTMELREEVIIALNSRYPALKKLFGIKKIGIFGSLARGDDHPDSDIDIEVEFDQGSDTYRNYIGLAWYLEELLGGRRVDLVTTRVLEGYLHSDVIADHAERNRDRVYISRMLDEMVFLLQRKKNLGFREFAHDDLMKRAAIRSLEIIGDGTYPDIGNDKKGLSRDSMERTGRDERPARRHVFFPGLGAGMGYPCRGDSGSGAAAAITCIFALKSVHHSGTRAGKKRLSLPSHS